MGARLDIRTPHAQAKAMDGHDLAAGSDARSIEDMAMLMVRGSGGPGKHAGAFSDGGAQMGMVGIQSFMRDVDGEPSKRPRADESEGGKPDQDDDDEEEPGSEQPQSSPGKKAAWFDRDRSINMARRTASTTLDSLQKQVKETINKVAQILEQLEMESEGKFQDERKIATVRLALSCSTFICHSAYHLCQAFVPSHAAFEWVDGFWLGCRKRLEDVTISSQ